MNRFQSAWRLIALLSGLAIAALPAAAQSGKNGATWNDNYSNTVKQTGATKSYPDHDKNIPESVIASVLKDKASAEKVWAGQGGKVTKLEGSVASGKILVIVEFPQIIDTHVYVRNK